MNDADSPWELALVVSLHAFDFPGLGFSGNECDFGVFLFGFHNQAAGVEGLTGRVGASGWREWVP